MADGDLITAQYQVQWRGQLLGWPATVLGITNVTGWLDLPPVRSTPTDRPGRHGQIPSALKVSGRVVTVDFSDALEDDAPLGFDDTAEFRAWCDLVAPGEDDDEEPLVLWIDDRAELVYARCEKRSVPTDYEWSLGYRRATLQFSCSDPRRYGVVEESQSAVLFQPPAGGLKFPLKFALAFHASTRTFDTFTAINAGSVPTWPIFEVRGPAPGPIIVNKATGQQLRFAPDYVVADGVTLTIDTDQRTVVDSNGASQRTNLYQADWFPFNPGATVVQFQSFGSYEPSALLTATWRSAKM